MAVAEKSKTYVSHGKEFPRKEDADKHDALYQAREELETAQRKFQKLLAENAVTADGQRFNFGTFTDYYQIAKPYGSVPYLHRLSYLCYEWAVRQQVEHPEIVEIRGVKKDGERDRYVPINQLYADEDKAILALQVARREWLEERRKEIEQAEIMEGRAQ